MPLEPGGGAKAPASNFSPLSRVEEGPYGGRESPGFARLSPGYERGNTLSELDS